jgi:hypothetical protein
MQQRAIQKISVKLRIPLGIYLASVEQMVANVRSVTEALSRFEHMFAWSEVVRELGAAVYRAMGEQSAGGANVRG